MSTSAGSELTLDAVQIVKVDLLEPPIGAMDLLDHAERGRAAAFVYARDRRRFVTAHACLRLTLGRLLGRPPEAFQFTTSPEGKPWLHEPQIDLRFNLSHSGERALIAVTIGRDVGVDIEQERPIDVPEIGRRFLTAREYTELQAMPESARMRALYLGWTRKEAFVKGLGKGLAYPLNDIDVCLGDGYTGQVLRTCVGDPDALNRWRVVSLDVDTGYAAALAVEGQGWQVMFAS